MAGTRTGARLRRYLTGIGAAILAGSAIVWVTGTKLVEGAEYSIENNIDAATVALWTSEGQPVEGWLLQGKGSGAVLLLHGIRADRRQMLARARFLHAAGYSVLLIDLPGHGASRAPAITFGLKEAHAVDAALRYLRRHYPAQGLGVIGVSLGAASYVLCSACPTVDAVVLESMYPTIEEAVEDRLRMRFGVLATPLSKLLLWQLPLRLGIQPEQLRPIERMHALSAPVLVMSGSEDRHTTIDETRRLHAAAKQGTVLWEVPGAAHVDLHDHAPVDYERRINTFLAQHLSPP